MACIYCGGPAPSDRDNLTQQASEETLAREWTKFREQHGPGACCNPCQYCRENVPHVPEVCANRQD